MKRLVVAAFAAFLVFGATTAQAVEKLTITYDLGGIVDVLIPQVFTSPVFSPGAAGPGGTGSTITFAFPFSGTGATAHPQTSIVSGVDILTFVQSNGITIPGFAVGYNRFEVTRKITGGHLFFGSFATGAGLALGQPNSGYIHCTATAAACPLIGVPAFYQSIPLPRDPTAAIPFGQPVAFPFPATSTQVPPPSRTIGMWLFEPSVFGTLLGIRPFCTAFTGEVGNSLCSGAQGIITLTGTEVSRTIIDTPEPALLPLVALSLLGAGGVAVWSRRRNKA